MEETNNNLEGIEEPEDEEPEDEAPAAPGSDATQRPLTNKQQLFVESYLTHGNATRAAKDAGYSPKTAYSIGQRELKKPHVWARIQQRLDEAHMSSNEVLARLSKVARGDVSAFIDDEGLFDLSTEEAKDNRFLIKKLKVKKRVSTNKDDPWTEIETEVELHDPIRAQELLGRYHKLFAVRVENTGPDGGPIQVASHDLEQAAKELREWREQRNQEIARQWSSQRPPEM